MYSIHGKFEEHVYKQVPWKVPVDCVTQGTLE